MRELTLFDQFGKEIKRNKPVLKEVGGTGSIRDRYSRYPSKGLTPEKLARIFRQADQGYVSLLAELFEEMEEKDAHLGAVLQTRKLAVAGLQWEIVPASDDAQDKKIADFIREALEWVDGLDDSLLDILDALGKGFSVSEILWEIADNKVWVKDIKWIHQKRFTFLDRDGTILENPRLFTDAEPAHGEDLLPNKFIVHRYKGRSGITPRGGLLRPCAWMYLFKNYSTKDWVVFNERFAMPMRVGKYKPGAKDEEVKVLENAIYNLGSDAAAVISDTTIIELLESQKTGSMAAFEKLLAYCNAAMSKAVLGHSASADSTPGRLGSETEARDVRRDLLEADAKALERTIKLQIIRPLVEYNYGPDNNLPSLRFVIDEAEDLEKTAKVYQAVQSMGFSLGEDHVSERFGIPVLGKDEKALVPVPQGVVPQANRSGYCPGCGERVAMKGGTGELDASDRIAGRLHSEVSTEGFTERIRQLLDTSATLEEFRGKLLDAYKDMDPSELGTVMAKALTVADLTGRFDAGR